MDTAEEHVRAPSVVRAWLVGHEARAIGVGMIVLVVVLCIGADSLLPVPGQPRKVPFWQLTPALLAMVASLATTNRLPRGRQGAQRLARGTWACGVISVAAGSSWVVGTATANLPSLVPGTVIAVAMTFAVSVLVGRVAVWVGAALCLVILARVTTMAADEDLWTSLPVSAQAAFAVVATIGVAAYAVRGARGVTMMNNEGNL